MGIIPAAISAGVRLSESSVVAIIADVIAPHFRQNDFYGGLAAGVSAITTLLDTEHFAAPAAKKAQSAKQEGSGYTWLPLLFIFLVLMSIRSRSKRSGLRSDGWGNAAGVILGSMISRGGGFGGGGGGGGGGGFSGGGGTFDGGGASGDW